MLWFTWPQRQTLFRKHIHASAEEAEASGTGLDLNSDAQIKGKPLIAFDGLTSFKLGLLSSEWVHPESARVLQISSITPKIIALFPDLAVNPEMYCKPMVTLRSTLRRYAEPTASMDCWAYSTTGVFNRFWDLATAVFAEDLDAASLGLLTSVKPNCSCCATQKIPVFPFIAEARTIFKARYTFLSEIRRLLNSQLFLRDQKIVSDNAIVNQVVDII